MKNELLFIFAAIKSVLLKESNPKEPENLDWGWIYNICANHNVANILAYAKESTNYNIPNDIDQKFSGKMLERLMVSENQNVATEKLFKSFNDNGIEYMPLKGVLLQNLYPSRDMRFMADVDILINPEQKEKLNKIMMELGYEFKVESDHEYVYHKKPYISVELHKRLIPSYNDDMYAYYGDGWKRAIKSERNPFEFELSKEDNFIYIFTHFAKHYRDTGIGIKSILDIWLYYEKYADMDMDYIKKQLKKLNLDEFYDNTQKLIKCWFYKANFDEITVSMTEFIINSGTFGNIKNQTLARTLRDYIKEDVSRATRGKYIRIMFPKLERMKKGYPILEKIPILLPMFWIVRGLKTLVFKRKNIEIQKRSAESITVENIDYFSKHMQDVGLDIYNGRE